MLTSPYHQQHYYHAKPRFSTAYLLLAGISFTSCLLLSWYTYEKNTVFLPEQLQLQLSALQKDFYALNGYDSASFIGTANESSATSSSKQQQIVGPNDSYLADLFHRRRQHIETICRRRYPKQRITHPQMLLSRGTKPFNLRLPSNLVVSEPLKVVFCSIPKVASSNWYTYFDELSRNFTFTGKNITQNHSIPVLKSINSYSPAMAKKILETYTKIMWVREPLQRLVSAWRDKLTVYNPYYSKVVGSVIIKSFRKNATKEQIQTGYPTSLEEFFNYLKNQQRTRYDVHWRPYYFACAPCNLPLMQFDYVGHLETIDIEADYVMRHLLRRDDYPPFPAGYQNRTSNDVLKRVLAQVSPSLVDTVLRNFQIDYELYGYDQPKF